MKINYCLPIIKTTKQEVLETIKVNQDYIFFEVWLDYIDDLKDEFVQQLINDNKGKLILLFRRQKLEGIHMDIDKRREIIDAVANKDVYLDLDVNNQQEELEYIQENNLSVKLITSYHNYDETPSLEELKNIPDEMHYYNPEIYKIATYCQTEQDALKLLELLLTLRQEEKKYIVLGMGEQGSVTRVFGTIWGNKMIFAPKEKNENSAPGQLTKMQLETIFKNLSFRA